MNAPQPNHIRAIQCEGKYGFATFYSAKRVAESLGAANPYRCPHCQQFHVGHAAPKAPVRHARRPAVHIDGFED